MDTFPQTRQVGSVGGKNGSIWQYPSFSLRISTGVIFVGSFEVSNMSVMMLFEDGGFWDSRFRIWFFRIKFSGSGFQDLVSGSDVPGSGFQDLAFQDPCFSSQYFIYISIN